MLIPAREAEFIVQRRIAQGSRMMASLPSFLKSRRVCVQAGGNWGYWPLILSELFDTVYTFEPDNECFTCLSENTRGRSNVVRLQAALGNERRLVDLWRDTDTSGNQRINGAGIYPTLRIDDLGLPVCDLIYLDVEGQEAEALKGAVHTIHRCKPIVAFEQRVSAFKEQSEEAMELITSHGYTKVGTIGSDVVMVPC